MAEIDNNKIMVGDVYWYTYLRIRVYLLVHLAAIAYIDSYSNSCIVECKDRCVCSLRQLCSIGPLLAPDSPST